MLQYSKQLLRLAARIQIHELTLYFPFHPVRTKRKYCRKSKPSNIRSTNVNTVTKLDDDIIFLSIYANCVFICKVKIAQYFL